MTIAFIVAQYIYEHHSCSQFSLAFVVVLFKVGVPTDETPSCTRQLPFAARYSDNMTIVIKVSLLIYSINAITTRAL